MATLQLPTQLFCAVVSIPDPKRVFLVHQSIVKFTAASFGPLKPFVVEGSIGKFLRLWERTDWQSSMVYQVAESCQGDGWPVSPGVGGGICGLNGDVFFDGGGIEIEVLVSKEMGGNFVCQK